MGVSSLSNFISPYSEAIHAKAAAVINLSAILLLPQRTAAGPNWPFPQHFGERKKKGNGGRWVLKIFPVLFNFSEDL